MVKRYRVIEHQLHEIYSESPKIQNGRTLVVLYTDHADEMKEVLEALRDMPSRAIPDYGEAKQKHDILYKYRHYLKGE